MTSGFTVNLVILCAAVLSATFAGAAWHLAIHGKDYAGFLAGATGMAASIPALLGSTRTKPADGSNGTGNGASKVQVVNTPANPVQVEETSR